MKYKIGFVSLGCAKNLVDTEVMLGILGEEGYEIVSDPSEAHIIVVNTCGFIESAKEESIAAVLEMAEYKKQNCKLLIMSGCLAERYHDEILTEIPEVDAVVGTGDYTKIADVIARALGGEKVVLFGHMNDAIEDIEPRIISTQAATAYLKIADGCDNHCTYCIIPKLRGKYRSRKMESILEEAHHLAKQGVKELILIAQDTTRYGMDLYGEYRLPQLLKQLCEIREIHWIRVHYLYPEVITDELIRVFATQDKIVKYMDIPIQHSSDAILKRMGRSSTKKQLVTLLHKLKEQISGLVIRTTLIVGFPGETEEQFRELKEFIVQMRFDRLGVFPYSREEDTAAALLDGQVEEEIKESRAEEIMEIQKEISYSLQQEKIGKSFEVLTEGYDMENLMYYGRTYGDSIDIDTTVYFAADHEVPIGTFVWVEIIDADQYDLTGILSASHKERSFFSEYAK